MKKICFNFNIAFIILCVFTSCEGYLNPTVYNRFSNANYPNTEEDFTALVTGIYGQFRFDNAWYRYSVCPQSRLILGEIGTEELWINWEWCNNPHIRFDFNPSYDLFYDFYDRMVPSVAKATFALSLIDECTTLPEDLKQRFAAEVKCCRAFWLYDLQGFYGSPVVVLDPERAKYPTSDYFPPRLSDEELFEFIEKDLLSAIDVLPVRYEQDSDFGRFTKGAASSLLLKLYMRHKKFDKAIEISEEIMGMGYALEKDYTRIWAIDNEKNPEIVFSIQCNSMPNENSNLMRCHVLPGDWVSPIDAPADKYSGYRVPWAVYDIFDSDDKRKSTLVKDYLVWENGEKVMVDGRATGRIPNGALPLKYGEDPSSNGVLTGNDIVLIRYADVLMLRAEALNEIHGPNQESIELINQIRIRAFGNDKPEKLIKLDQFSSKQQLKEYILQERLFEFCFEGERREDLIRHGKYIEFAQKRGINAQPHQVRYPLPSHLIIEGNGNIKQNEGY